MLVFWLLLPKISGLRLQQSLFHPSWEVPIWAILAQPTGMVAVRWGCRSQGGGRGGRSYWGLAVSLCVLSEPLCVFCT